MAYRLIKNQCVECGATIEGYFKVLCLGPLCEPCAKARHWKFYAPLTWDRELRIMKEEAAQRAKGGW